MPSEHIKTARRITQHTTQLYKNSGFNPKQWDEYAKEADKKWVSISFLLPDLRSMLDCIDYDDLHQALLDLINELEEGCLPENHQIEG